jgi:ferredoxin
MHGFDRGDLTRKQLPIQDTPVARCPLPVADLHFKLNLEQCRSILPGSKRDGFDCVLDCLLLEKLKTMAHVVTDKCNQCKFTDCVEVCPVACFYEMDNQVVIHPEDCIDCTACVAECPVEAIYAEGDLPAQYQANMEFNGSEARQLKDSGQPAILKKKDPLPTAEKRKAELGY